MVIILYKFVTWFCVAKKKQELIEQEDKKKEESLGKSKRRYNVTKLKYASFDNSGS